MTSDPHSFSPDAPSASPDLVIIGGGPAGLAAAIAAKKAGCDKILILERDHVRGGILNQCIHNGFGLHTFHEELTGPEYAYRFIKEADELQIPWKNDTMVMHLANDLTISALNPREGFFTRKPKAVILAMGCRERPRGALNIPGFRPAGVYSAGTAQRLVNMEGYLPGREVVILGSGDIGLIMARRMTLEGANVKCVAELLPYSGGLKRNIVQCLDDFDIPLLLSHTVVSIEGKKRVCAVTLAQVDENRQPIPGTERRIPCDTLLLSTGLIPENELSRGAGVSLNPVTGGPFVDESLQTSVPGIFACGNVLHVHDLVDNVSAEAKTAGEQAAAYIRALPNSPTEGNDSTPVVRLCAGRGVRYTVPSTLRTDRMPEVLHVFFRADNVYRPGTIQVTFNGEPFFQRAKKIITPGEMEQVLLQKKDLVARTDLKEITISIRNDIQNEA